MAFTTEQEDALLRYATFFSTISLLGSILVLVSFVRFPELRVFALKLIALLAVADIGTDIPYYLGDPDTGSFKCTLQAVLRVYFNLVAILLTTVIANFMYEVILFQNFELIEQQQRRPTYQLYAWGVPVLLAMLPFTTSNYGSNGAYCSVTSDTGDYWWGVFWHVTCLYLPCWVAIGYNVSVFLTVQRYVRGLELSDVGFEGEKEDRTATNQRALRLQFVERLQLYPLVLAVSWVWATIYCIQSILEPDHQIFWLACFAYSMCSIMGFLNACVFFATPSVWKAWFGRSSIDGTNGSMLCQMGGLFGRRRSGGMVDGARGYSPSGKHLSEQSSLLDPEDGEEEEH